MEGMGERLLHCYTRMYRMGLTASECYELSGRVAEMELKLDRLVASRAASSVIARSSAVIASPTAISTGAATTPMPPCPSLDQPPGWRRRRAAKAAGA
jgi:hypothetical protein